MTGAVCRSPVMELIYFYQRVILFTLGCYAIVNKLLLCKTKF
nr:MAG TPA: hypothetical protein [Caudoviricetes sp.]